MLISIPIETLVDRIIVAVFSIIRMITSMSPDLVLMELMKCVEDLSTELKMKCK